MRVSSSEFELPPKGNSAIVPVLDHNIIFGAGSSGTKLYRSGLKRFFETTLVILTAPVTVPFILLLALLVSLDGGRPFYNQKRVGLGGRVFRIWKLRTMVIDADARLQAHLASNPDAQIQWLRTQKLKQDPRVTPIGRILRKISLDELPQLLNVLNGTMALVGPRPMMLDQQSIYLGGAYYRLRPGITGPWQVSERNESEFVARVRYDEAYERDMSFAGDLSIMARTVAVVLRATGY